MGEVNLGVRRFATGSFLLPIIGVRKWSTFLICLCFAEYRQFEEKLNEVTDRMIGSTGSLRPSHKRTLYVR